MFNTLEKKYYNQNYCTFVIRKESNEHHIFSLLDVLWVLVLNVTRSNLLKKRLFFKYVQILSSNYFGHFLDTVLDATITLEISSKGFPFNETFLLIRDFPHVVQKITCMSIFVFKTLNQLKFEK